MAKMWIKYEGGVQSIDAANWRIWKLRGAEKAKPPKQERAVKGPGGEAATEYPKHVGGGWYDRGDGGANVRKSDLTDEELERVE